MTLEDAAEELVVKLKALEAEIEESDHKLEDLRERVETAVGEVEADWIDLTDAVTSLLEKVSDEGEQLHQQVEDTLQALNDAHNGVGENATAARNEIAQANTQLDALGQQATALEPVVQSLVSEAGEAPANALADRARELEQELSTLIDEARDFLRDEVVPAIEQVAEEARTRCEELHRVLSETHTQALQQAYDEWEQRVDELEDYVLTKGYQASHQHAKEVVEYAMEECQTGSLEQIDAVQQLVGLLETQLQELASQVSRAASDLDQNGQKLRDELEGAKDAAVKALAGLDTMKQELAERSFMAS
jgi:ABC-type transporter Mla subunit MlaD